MVLIPSGTGLALWLHAVSGLRYDPDSGHQYQLLEYTRIAKTLSIGLDRSVDIHLYAVSVKQHK